MREENNIKFLLEGIKIEQFAIFKQNYNTGKELELKTGFEFKLDDENQKIGIFVGVEFVQESKVFIKIVVSSHFKISESSWNHLINQANQFVLPKDFITHLTMLSIGTARGVLYAKTEGTEFAKFILPTMNLSDIIQDDILLEEI